MARIHLWLKNGSTLTRIAIDGKASPSRLVEEVMSRAVLPGEGRDGTLFGYDVVCVRTGIKVNGSPLPLASLVRDGDTLVLREPRAHPSQGAASPAAIGSFSKGTFLKPGDQPDAFTLTAISPFNLDYATRYPVLAIRTRTAHAGHPGIVTRAAPASGISFVDRKQIYAKDAYFLTADPGGRFQWVPPHESSFYRPELNGAYPPERRKRLTRYSVEDDVKEDTHVIYPVRPFSITGVDLDGFDSGKAYPVLAIDVDRYLPEEGEGPAEQPEGIQPETMAIFLVGDDNGSFTWVGEDQCRLYPLET